jgi:hypothetical protein
MRDECLRMADDAPRLDDEEPCLSSPEGAMRDECLRMADDAPRLDDEPRGAWISEGPTGRPRRVVRDTGEARRGRRGARATS